MKNDFFVVERQEGGVSSAVLVLRSPEHEITLSFFFNYDSLRGNHIIVVSRAITSMFS